MRTGIIVKVTAAERDRLKAIVADRSSPQKHVWRAGIVLATAEGLGTVAIMQRTAKSKTAVWRWQERFAQEGVDGLLRYKTGPSRVKPFRHPGPQSKPLAKPLANSSSRMQGVGLSPTFIGGRLFLAAFSACQHCMS
jgi:hypothetical protein